jgi:catechol 2,3-dioxygenase-like lactoylglutathione lyase family enzyme
MIDHVTLQVADVRTSMRFYEALLAPLQMRLDFDDGTVVGLFGPETDSGSLWLCPAQRTEDRELHMAFRAADRSVVQAFYDAALGLGAEVLHAPRVFPEYGEHYFGAFVRDPDGHNIEAVCRAPAG